VEDGDRLRRDQVQRFVSASIFLCRGLIAGVVVLIVSVLDVCASVPQRTTLSSLVDVVISLQKLND
jgi:hypothetical protein